jgi:hypothetical protein
LERGWVHIDDGIAAKRVGREGEDLGKDSSSFPRAPRRKVTFHFHFICQHHE